MDTILGQAGAAAAKALKARDWNTPAWPVGQRNWGFDMGGYLVIRPFSWIYPSLGNTRETCPRGATSLFDFLPISECPRLVYIIRSLIDFTTDVIRIKFSF